MRLIPLCLFGLLAMAMLPQALVAEAQAAPRPDSRAAAGKAGKAAAIRPTASAARGPLRPAMAAAPRATGRAAAASRTTVSVKPGNAGRRGAVLQRTASRTPVARVQAGRTVAAREPLRRVIGPRLTSWQSGLPMAEGEQRECPVGTMSTLARGHDDVVRCLPL